jgi:DNA-binding SARP family transcriptional activator/streptogramin lyase
VLWSRSSRLLLFSAAARCGLCRPDHERLKEGFPGPKGHLKEGDTTAIEFRILGSLEAVENGRRLALGGTKQRALLGLLLLHANRVVSRDRLIDELWDSSPPDTAPTALQVHVSQLRKALGRDAIVTQAPGYMVSVEPGALDSDRFEQLVHDAHGVDADGAAERLREALALWRGPPLADLDDSLARPERAQLEDKRASALEQRIDADLELGRHADLVPELEALVREDPLRERRRAQLMLALYRSGRQADALNSYRNGRTLLADELGLEPGTELRQLEKAILEHDPALAPPAPPPRAGRTSEERGRLLAKRSRLALGLGALLLAGAVTSIVLAFRGGSNPIAVRANSVAALDPVSGRVTADVPIGGQPVAITLGGGSVWVANADDQTVIRVNPRTRKVEDTIGGLGTDVSDLAFAFGSVWVAGGNDGTLMRIDPRDRGVRQLDLVKGREPAPQPVFLVAAGAGSVWVTRGNQVLQLDPKTNQVITRTRVLKPQALGVGAQSAWASTEGEHMLRIEPHRGEVVVNKDLSQPTYFPLVYRGSLWVIAAANPPLVLRLEPGTLAQEGVIQFPKQFPFELASGEGAVWTADHDGGQVWKIDPETTRATRLANVGLHPVAIAAGAGAVWVGVQAEPFFGG